MPKFAANISLMFTEVPFLQRFAAARAAGFRAVEFQFPYAFSAADVALRARDAGLQVTLFNLPPGDFDRGERGIACLPGRESEFSAGIETTLEYARALNCSTINCLAGIRPQSLARATAATILVDNLERAADALARENIALVIEPLNAMDVPGFLLHTSADALKVMEKVQHANLKLQYDVYHMQRMEGEITETLTRLLPRIGHVQIADAPTRHEPGTGEINFRTVLNHIDSLAYQGWVGCEYRPKSNTSAGLHWVEEHGFSL